MTKPVNVEYLQERVADLEAEVERLRGIDQASADGVSSFMNYKFRDDNPHPAGELRVAWWGGYDGAKNAEALRRVVEAAQRVCEESSADAGPSLGAIVRLREALAFAKGVMER